jgi:uncharacterized membrane protein YczE
MINLFYFKSLLTVGLFIFWRVTDFELEFTYDMQIQSYLLQWLLCIVSIFVIAFCVFLEAKVNGAMLDGEGKIL